VTLFTDNIQSGLERALDAVSLRQRVTSDNLANAMTPGYRAQRVDFENALAGAIASGDPASSPVAVRDAGNPAREDGNSVIVEDEAATLMRSGLQYQALVEATTYKLGLLRTAISGR